MNIEFPRKHADDKDSEPVKFEISIKPVTKDCYGDKDRKKDRDKGRDRDFDKDCDKGRDKDFEKDCDKGRDKEFEKDCDKDRDKDYDYDTEFEYDEKSKTLIVCADKYCKSNVITVKACDDLVCKDLGDYFFEQNGFILELSIRFKDVCPKRRTALALILYELDKCGNEYIRGFKTVLIPSAGKYVCDDVCVKCLRFVVPEALDISGDKKPCGPRKFVVRYTANYVDSDFSVCGCFKKD